MRHGFPGRTCIANSKCTQGPTISEMLTLASFASAARASASASPAFSRSASAFASASAAFFSAAACL